MLLTLPLKSDFYLSPQFITKNYDKEQQKMVSLLSEMRLQFKGRCTQSYMATTLLANPLLWLREQCSVVVNGYNTKLLNERNHCLWHSPPSYGLCIIESKVIMHLCT